MKLLAELPKDTDADVRCTAREAPPARCEEVGPELAAQAMMLLAEPTKDSDRHVRQAARRAPPACCERVAQSSPRIS